MERELIAGIILVAIGILFFFNNKSMGAGLSEFYKKLYTKKNTIIMFRIAGVILVVGGLVLVFLR